MFLKQLFLLHFSWIPAALSSCTLRYDPLSGSSSFFLHIFSKNVWQLYSPKHLVHGHLRVFLEDGLGMVDYGGPKSFVLRRSRRWVGCESWEISPLLTFCCSFVCWWVAFRMKLSIDFLNSSSFPLELINKLDETIENLVLQQEQILLDKGYDVFFYIQLFELVIYST